MSKEEIYDLYFTEEKDEEDSFWKMLVGTGGVLLAIITLERVK